MKEKDLFQEIWAESNKKCFVTQDDLSSFSNTDMWYSCFAHVLRKSAFPEFKFNKENIVLLKPEVHDIFDNGYLQQIKKYEKEKNCSFLDLFLLEKRLYTQYISLFGVKTIFRKLADNYLTCELQKIEL